MLVETVASDTANERFEERERSGAVRSIWLTRLNWYLLCKTAVDAILACLMLVITAPLLLLLVLMVKLTSRGPAFYAQSRVGKNGRLYTMYKIRTMIDNCEALTGPKWATCNDPRVNPLGRLLRSSHLDELPQLWNVLRGEMSLIGPRPERPEIVPQLEQDIPYYQDRMSVRPGITGLAQLHLPADTDLASVRRKLTYDLYYLRQLSPWSDLRIALCTAVFLLGIPFRVSQKLFSVPSGPTIERAFGGWVSESKSDGRTEAA